MVNSRIGSISGHLFSPAGKPEDARSGVANGLQYNYYGGALVALALKPSDFCNIGDNAFGLRYRSPRYYDTASSLWPCQKHYLKAYIIHDL
jgi:hypothetical protein